MRRGAGSRWVWTERVCVERMPAHRSGDTVALHVVSTQLTPPVQEHQALLVPQTTHHYHHSFIDQAPYYRHE